MSLRLVQSLVLLMPDKCVPFSLLVLIPLQFFLEQVTAWLFDPHWMTM